MTNSGIMGILVAHDVDGTESIAVLTRNASKMRWRKQHRNREYTPTLREAENSPLPNGATQILPLA